MRVRRKAWQQAKHTEWRFVQKMSSEMKLHGTNIQGVKTVGILNHMLQSIMRPITFPSYEIYQDLAILLKLPKIKNHKIKENMIKMTNLEIEI